MSDETKELRAVLDEHLAVKDESGNVVLQVALLVTVYFEDQWRRDVREAVASCCEDYFQRCGQHLRWALNPTTKRMEPFGKGKGSVPGAWLPMRGEEQAFSLICHGAEYNRGAGASSIRSFGARRYPYPTLGFFRVSFPLLWFADNPGSLPEAALDICRKLNPVSGYGGIGVIESPDDAINGWYEPRVYDLAQRFPGLEADYPISHSNWLPKGRTGDRAGIKGVNWLTILGDRFLAEMGGADRVEADLAALDSRMILHRVGGGALIQAGSRPALGDAERGRWPELYVKLTKYLKPIRITEHRPFQQGGAGLRFDLERSKAWLRRFDDR
jgi:hypothetical protein